MKYTLLDLVQMVASSCDSDEVNTINDSTESLKIAYIVRSCFYDIISRANLPEHYDLVQLTASGDNSLPTVMTIPGTVAEVIWIKYDNRTFDTPERNMQPVKYLSLPDFLYLNNQLSTDDTNTGQFTITYNSIPHTFKYRNDVAPEWYTSTDDNHLVFSSYDAGVDTTLQSSKMEAYCRLQIPFTLADNFVPDLNEAQFALLLNESKSMAWAELKQTIHAKAEKNAQRGWVRLQTTKSESERETYFDRLPNYGRK